MELNPFTAREFFHAAALKHLAVRLAGRAWALKGGVCLRLFHGSARLSEDMDLDVDPGMRLETLERGVDAVLASGALKSELVRGGLSVARTSKPKQIETTQRWKVELELAGEKVQTKVEFSRRRERPPAARGMPEAALLDRYSLTDFGAQYYEAGEMALQKLAALAADNRAAVRDLYDLDHLWRRRKEPVAAAVAQAEGGLRNAAAVKAEGFAWKDFQGQVLPYLEPEARTAYDAAAFARLKEALARRLRGATE